MLNGNDLWFGMSLRVPGRMRRLGAVNERVILAPIVLLMLVRVLVHVAVLGVHRDIQVFRRTVSVVVDVMPVYECILHRLLRVLVLILRGCMQSL